MYVFESDNINTIFLNVLQTVRKEGYTIEKEDGKVIKEIFPVSIRLTNPKHGLLFVGNRPYSPSFMAAETLWNLSADKSDWLVQYCKLYGKYFTNNELKSAYGYRIFHYNNTIDQIKKTIDLLRYKPLSQHCTVSIFDPTEDLDFNPEPKFVPCILFLKFKIRHGRLCMTTFMRSQDIWTGFPYDINLLLSIFQLVSKILGVEMGQYIHHCDTVRLYKVDWEEAEHVEKIESELSQDILLDFPFSGYKQIRRKLSFYSSVLSEIGCNYESLRSNKHYDIFLDQISSEPEYFKNLLKSCYAYKLIHLHEYKKALRTISEITNVLKKQFKIWAKKYHPSFGRML